MNSSLIARYNVQGPRYTSYPTVPYWNAENFTIEQWKKSLIKTFQKNPEEGISLYIHLPYCESLCTYCGCNTRITVNHGVEKPYIETILKEWKMYVDLLGQKPFIRELHLGGGTPTFFSPDHLTELINGIFEYAMPATQHEFGFEGHPSNTTISHLQALYQLGFRRVSFGIQDFNPIVQFIINRYQTFEQVEKVTAAARKIGYTSVNYDLIYGLPLQTLEGVTTTIDQVKYLAPDRIAFYSYAHVPWMKPGQRRYTDEDLPKPEAKRAMYETGRNMLEEAGYHEIGMDHFSTKDDSLYKAMQNGSLHRNFMGYTDMHTELMISLGVSSISDSWNAFAQNHKVVEQYKAAVDNGELPVMKGHLLTESDVRIRQHILNLMCRFETRWNESENELLQEGVDRLHDLEADGLVAVLPQTIRVTETGKAFIRNICMAFDERLWAHKPETQLFSQTV